MPISTQLLFTFASGVLTALVARAELRSSPASAFMLPAFAAYLTFVALVLIPGSVYLYVFHGDWYLLYLVDTQRVPSALVVLGAALIAALGAAGYLLGAVCIRAQRDALAGVVAGVVVSLAVGSVVLMRPRLAVVGSFAQFRGDFGLAPFGGPLLYAVVCITLATLIGFSLLAYQLHPGQRRT